MEAKDLVLEVKEQRLGVLITNALEIKKFVEAKLEGYSPANYVGKIAEAKADRAELNKASRELNSKRLELEKSFMRPFDEFKGIIRETTDAIGKASKALDEIVKGEENRERDEKRAEIQAAWDKLNFDIVPLDRVFDPKWLNKATRLPTIWAEMEVIKDGILSDLRTLESLDDPEDLKAFYLKTLDLGETIRRAEEMKANKERIRQYEEQRKPKDPEPVEVPEPMEEPEPTPEPVQTPEQVQTVEEQETYTLKLTGSRSSLRTLRAYIDELGITYEVIK